MAKRYGGSAMSKRVAELLEALLTRPFSTRAARSRSMRQRAAKARTTRWSPRR